MMNNVGRSRLIENERGMTMIEVVFASVVLFGAIIVMLGMFETSINMLQFTTSRSMGTQIASEQIENIRSRDYEQVFNAVPSEWPEDSDLSTATTPPKYIDVDDVTSATVLRTINTSTAADGILVERSVTRNKINFTVRNYVLWVDDGATSNAFKRVITKVIWGKPNPAGDVTMITNFSKENEREPRPTIEILGVVSSNYNYFSAASQNTTMGIDDSIRGGSGSPYSAPIVYTRASYTSSLAKYIDRVVYTLYSPSGDTLLTSTVASGSADSQGRFALAINTKAYADNAGYLIKAEAFDDLGAGDIDTLRVNFDNTNPPGPTDVTVVALGPELTRLTWNWTPLGGDPLPTVNRFMIYRKIGGSTTPWAAVVGSARTFYDTNPEVYTYFVRAVDGAGNNELNMNEKARGDAPPATPDVWDPGNITTQSASAVSWKSVEIIWEQVSDDAAPGNTGVAGYEWWGSDNGASWKVIASTSDTVSNPAYYQDTGLYPGRTYYYRGKAFDFAGNDSPSYSPTLQVTTPLR